MKTIAAVTALGALAHETRLEVFRLLVRAGAEGLSVGKIADALGIEANGRLTFHLKELVNAGLISCEPRGRNLIYRADFARMNSLLGYLTQHCCQGEACELDCEPDCEPGSQGVC